MTEIWKPSVTVAAIVERDRRFLLVEEEVNGAIVLNQPAGHWERDETLVQACSREAREETGYDFVPTRLVGVYRWCFAPEDVTFLRFAFAGDLTGWDPERNLDKEIRRLVWLDLEALRATAPRHRSSLVLRCVEDYLAGRLFPIDILADLS